MTQITLRERRAGLAPGVYRVKDRYPAIGIAPMASTLSDKTLFITGASRASINDYNRTPYTSRRNGEGAIPSRR